MKRKPTALRVARYLETAARRIRRGLLGDVRILAALMERAAVALRQGQ